MRMSPSTPRSQRSPSSAQAWRPPQALLPRCSRLWLGAGINIRMISTSEIKISVLINEEDSEKAVKAIHEQFFNA